MWPFSKKENKDLSKNCWSEGDNEKIGDECLAFAKSMIAKNKEFFVNSPEQLAAKIIAFAENHKANKIALARGYRHTPFYNYNSLECNFIIDGKWYIFVTADCNDIKNSGGLRYSAGPADEGLTKYVLPKIIATEAYTKTGKFNSGYLRDAITEIYETENMPGILKFCREFLKPVLERNSTMC